MTTQSPARLRLGMGWSAAAMFAILFAAFGLRWQSNGLDTRVATWCHAVSYRHGFVASAARWVTTLGSTPVLIGVVLAAASALWAADRPGHAFEIVLFSAGSSVLVSVCKQLTSRPRPQFVHPVATASGYAFPSGHTANSTVVYGLILLTVLPVLRVSVRRVARSIFGVLVGLIAVSRLLLGVHWLSDVLAGAALGAAVLCVVRWRWRRAPGYDLNS